MDGLATSDAAGAFSLSAAPSAADSMFGDALGKPASFNFDSWGTENQLSPSADPLNFEYDNLDGNSSPEFQDFDFDRFISTTDDFGNGASNGPTAGHDSIVQDHPDFTSSLFDLENQVPSEAFNQQPHTGASFTGCDDGVLAVGV